MSSGGQGKKVSRNSEGGSPPHVSGGKQLGWGWDGTGEGPEAKGAALRAGDQTGWGGGHTGQGSSCPRGRSRHQWQAPAVSLAGPTRPRDTKQTRREARVPLEALTGQGMIYRILNKFMSLGAHCLEREKMAMLFPICLPIPSPQPWPKKKKEKRGKKSIATAKKEIALIQIVLFKNLDSTSKKVIRHSPSKAAEDYWEAGPFLNDLLFLAARGKCEESE